MAIRPAQGLALEFRRKIESGQWPVGERLPTTRQLSVEYGVSVNTVQSAFRVLEAHDLVDRRPRRGGYVKSRRGSLPPTEGTTPSTGTAVAIIAEAVSQNEPREGHNWCYWIARAAERELGAADYHIELLSWAVEDQTSADRLRDRIDAIRARLAGAICFPMPGMAAVATQLRGYGVPCVTINRPTDETVEDFVTANNIEAGRLLGRCFGRMGFESVAVLGQGAYASSSMEKYLGIVQGYMGSGFPSRNVEYVHCADYHEADGHAALAAYVERSGRPRAVFGNGDYLALGALRLCRERGWDVPGEVAVVGGTGLDLARYTTPALSVLEQPMDAMGAEAARMLLQMIGRGQLHLPGRYVRGTLACRESFVVPQDLAAELGVVMPPANV